MNFIEFIGAVGIGGIVVKVLDIFLLQKIISTNERNKWLREKRLKFFSEFSGCCQSLSLREKDTDVLELLSMSAKIKLLIDNKTLIDKIDELVNAICVLHFKKDQEEDLKGKITTFLAQSNIIVNDLRAELLKISNSHDSNLIISNCKAIKGKLDTFISRYRSKVH